MQRLCHHVLHDEDKLVTNNLFLFAAVSQSITTQTHTVSVSLGAAAQFQCQASNLSPQQQVMYQTSSLLHYHCSNMNMKQEKCNFLATGNCIDSFMYLLFLNQAGKVFFQLSICYGCHL